MRRCCWVAARVLGHGRLDLGGCRPVRVLCRSARPWTVLGFWNALIGLWLLHFRKDALAEVAPYAAAGDQTAPLRIKTAIFMTVRNEDPGSAPSCGCKTVKASVDATGEGGAFSYFVLSDTSDPAVAAAEEAGRRGLEGRRSRSRPHRLPPPHRQHRLQGRQRARLLRPLGQRTYALMLPLDADSLMSGAQIVRLTRMMQAHPKIGILQSLVVGMPVGQRVCPHLPVRHAPRHALLHHGPGLVGGRLRPVLGPQRAGAHQAVPRASATCRCCPASRRSAATCSSHDQVEATLMRRAGYEVRVLPEERGSWEENPPTMLEFARRDVRWCQGNMQYLKLLDLPGLYPMSRFQLVWAILMFIGIPAWTLMIALLPVAAWRRPQRARFSRSTLAIGLYVTFFTMYLMPKIAGAAGRDADARRAWRATAAGCGSCPARRSSWRSRSCRARCRPSAPRSS